MEGDTVHTSSEPNLAVELPRRELARLARRYRVARLALFGSVLRPELFGDGSDVDMLVRFLPGTRISFLTLARLQGELADLLRRPVDLVPEAGLKPLIRDAVVGGSYEIYAA